MPCISLIMGNNCRISPFWCQVFHRKRSVLICNFLWMISDHQKQQVLLSDQHSLFLDQLGKIYRGHIFGEEPRGSSPWLSLLLEAELSSCPSHAFKTGLQGLLILPFSSVNIMSERPVRPQLCQWSLRMPVTKAATTATELIRFLG